MQDCKPRHGATVVTHTINMAELLTASVTRGVQPLPVLSVVQVGETVYTRSHSASHPKNIL